MDRLMPHLLHGRGRAAVVIPAMALLLAGSSPPASPSAAARPLPRRSRRWGGDGRPRCEHVGWGRG